GESGQSEGDDHETHGDPLWWRSSCPSDALDHGTGSFAAEILSRDRTGTESSLANLLGKWPFWGLTLYFAPYGQGPGNQEANQGGREHPAHHQDDADDRDQQVRQGPAAGFGDQAVHRRHFRTGDGTGGDGGEHFAPADQWAGGQGQGRGEGSHADHHV